MDRQTIIAIIACVLLLIFWNQIARFLGLIPEAPPPPSTSFVDSLAPADSLLPRADTLSSAIPPNASEKPPQAFLKAIDSLIPEKLINVRTPLYDLVFSTHGGGIKKISLRQFHYNDHNNVILADASDKIVPDLQSSGGEFRTGQLAFACDQADAELIAGSDPIKIEFVHDNGHGGRIAKTYTIYPDRYDIGLNLAIEAVETFGLERSYYLLWDVTPPPSEKNKSDDFGYFKVVAMMDDHREFNDYKQGVMNEQLPGYTVWVGLRTKYFAAIMAPRNRDGGGVVARGVKHKIDLNGKSFETRELAAAVEMPIPNYGSVRDTFLLYVGPIKYRILKSYNLHLEELASLGWVLIKPFSIAIIWLLPRIYSLIPNYGVVVIIFAFLIKLVTYPLTRKQNIAMARMKDLQPKMKALQERHKNDPARLNKEVMKLYKEAGANPLSGCLPLLAQMPLFFALFTVFRTTIEFRSASFVGWIADLSVPDPYYILPIVMVIVMFVQQSLTMTDPKNKFMVYAMPLFFGWMSLNFPAGLVLYWTAFSLLSFIEATLTRRRMIEAAAVVDAEK